jgi:hypothetical protein
MTLVRWLIAIALSFAVASPASAGVFKARGKDTSKPAAKKPAAEKKPAVTKKAPAKAAPAQKKVAAKKAPVRKKTRNSAVASKGRPDNLTPDPPKSKKKKGKASDVVITEDTLEDEDDVIIRDIDD